MSNSFIILSAQPDLPYYEWQLEIQFINLSELGFDLSKYHVLIAYRNQPSDLIKSLATRYPEVNWRFYPDTRVVTRSYVSSLRPHIIAKHFEENKWLENERFLYIDSDVIFRDLPPVATLQNPDTWYFSRADYVSIEHITKRGDFILTDMCRIAGIERDLVEANAHVKGGAQSWLNGTDAEFWRKLETDSTRLHDYLQLTWPIAAKRWSREAGQPEASYKKIDGYLADMWAILWLGLLAGKQVKVEEPMLDFCTPSQDIRHWDSCYMLHYSLMNKCEAPDYFIKSQFGESVDLTWNSSATLQNVCAVKYAEYVDKIIAIRRTLAPYTKVVSPLF